MVTEDDLKRIEDTLAGGSVGPFTIDRRPTDDYEGVTTAVIDMATGFDVMNDEPHESKAVHPGDQMVYLLARQMMPRMVEELRFLRRVLADMADDGKDVLTVCNYRRALEEIAAGHYGDGTEYSSIPQAHEIAACALGKQ